MMACACRQSCRVASGSGAPSLAMAAPPMGRSLKSSRSPCVEATLSRTVTAARVTSGPMPSPGRTTRRIGCRRWAETGPVDQWSVAASSPRGWGPAATGSVLDGLLMELPCGCAAWLLTNEEGSLARREPSFAGGGSACWRASTWFRWLWPLRGLCDRQAVWRHARDTRSGQHSQPPVAASTARLEPGTHPGFRHQAATAGVDGASLEPRHGSAAPAGGCRGLRYTHHPVDASLLRLIAEAMGPDAVLQDGAVLLPSSVTAAASALRLADEHGIPLRVTSGPGIHVDRRRGVARAEAGVTLAALGQALSDAGVA